MCKTIDAPRLAPRVLNNPVVVAFAVLVPADQLDGVARLEAGLALDKLVNTILVDEEVSVHRDDGNNGAVLVNFALDALLFRGDTLVKDFSARALVKVVALVILEFIRERGVLKAGSGHNAAALGIVKAARNDTALAAQCEVLVARQQLLRGQAFGDTTEFAESVSYGRNGSDGVGGGAVALVPNRLCAFRVLSAEVEPLRDDGRVLVRGAVLQLLFVGQLDVEELLGINYHHLAKEFVRAEFVG